MTIARQAVEGWRWVAIVRAADRAGAVLEFKRQGWPKDCIERAAAAAAAAQARAEKRDSPQSSEKTPAAGR